MMPLHRKPSTGFTLVELMIVVAIIAVLAAIAIPNYIDYITRSKLSEAYNSLSAYRVSMEQYYQDNRTYVGTALNTCGAVGPIGLKYFTLTCPASSSSTYTAQAQGNAGTPVAQFTFTINQSNTRATTSTPSGWGPNQAACWVVRKGGACQ
jgi:type IV pilus assembly protein PilE